MSTKPQPDPLTASKLQKARAAKTGDEELIAAAAKSHAAAQINTAIDRALQAAGVPLAREDAENLAARLRGAAER